MSEQLNYEEIGLVSGIEIHQQIEGRKLFCNCPTNVREDPTDIEVKRRLRAVVGETGKIDIAAAKEQAKSKFNIYQAYSDSTCLVELDEEPPHEMSEGALKLCLEVCKRFNCKVVDEVQVMRKTVIDGSNTTGFQRTSLVGHSGNFQLKSGKKIDIWGIMLEEDAAKIVEKTSEHNIYNLSKLGIPLFEVVTGPNLNNPAEIKEAAKTIGMLLRSSRVYQNQSVKRGLGTIRQDINISIRDGDRVEVKGAQDLKIIPTLVDYEILRQQKLIDIKNRNLQFDFELVEVDLTDILKNTNCKFIKETITKGHVVLGMKVPGFNGILGEETCPSRRVGSEISDYGKMASGVGGLIHSDEDLFKYKISEDEINSIKSALQVKDSDAFIMIADSYDKSKVALSAAHERISRLKEGVIREVRFAKEDGATSYMRPLPGGARMYPETDVLPIRPDWEGVQLGKTIEEREQEMLSLGIKNKDVAVKIAKDLYFEFLELSKELDLDSNTIASNIASDMTEKIKDTKEILRAMAEGKVAKNTYIELVELVKKGTPVKEAIDSKQSMPREEVEKIVNEVLSKFPDADKSKMGLLMGQIMSASKGKADGKIVNEILREILS